MAASNSNQLIEQKSANLNLEALLKEKTNMIQKIKEERNALSLELNENIIKYDIQIEELKNEVSNAIQHLFSFFFANNMLIS